MERFACGARIISGAGAVSALAEERCSRLLVVMHAADVAWGGKIRQAAGAAETDCFDDIDREPTVKQAVNGSQKIRQWKPDLVAALGDRAVIFRNILYRDSMRQTIHTIVRYVVYTILCYLHSFMFPWLNSFGLGLWITFNFVMALCVPFEYWLRKGVYISAYREFRKE